MRHKRYCIGAAIRQQPDWANGETTISRDNVGRLELKLKTERDTF